jgi:Holliday junction resolvase
MAQTPEGAVKAAVRKVLVEEDVYYFSPAANGFGRAGIPDIICCVQGFFLAIEIKAGKGKTTPLQNREIEAINSHGGQAMVVNEKNINEVKENIAWIKTNFKQSVL